MQTHIEQKTRAGIEKALGRLGTGEAVTRFMSSYGNIRTKKAYSSHLASYFTWLREKGVTMSPDELLVDNLTSIYRSQPEDVATKRKHRAWLEEYVNVVMVEQGFAEVSRLVLTSAVNRFYEKNDSPLFGKVEVSRQPSQAPPRPLSAPDVRSVLRALSVQVRTPLLFMWQSGCEVNRILALRWGDLEGAECPLKLQFYGRKRHRKPYYSFLGSDSIKALKLWRERWAEMMHREPGPDDLVFVGKTGNGADETWLGRELRRMALRLHRQGLVSNGDVGSWHTHALRHSFKTEAEHSGVKSGVVEFFMGHSGGIEFHYSHVDELHQDDYLEAYKKIEPHVSLDYTETTLRSEYEDREKMLLSKVLQLERDYESLKKEILSGRGAQRQSSQSAQ